MIKKEYMTPSIVVTEIYFPAIMTVSYIPIKNEPGTLNSKESLDFNDIDDENDDDDIEF